MYIVRFPSKLDYQFSNSKQRDIFEKVVQEDSKVVLSTENVSPFGNFMCSDIPPGLLVHELISNLTIISL